MKPISRIKLATIIISILICISVLSACEMGENKARITFESNGGTRVPFQTVAYGQRVTRPPDPVKEGFIFDGWYTTKNMTTKFDFDTVRVNANTPTILYAKYYSDFFDDEQAFLLNTEQTYSINIIKALDRKVVKIPRTYNGIFVTHITVPVNHVISDSITYSVEEIILPDTILSIADTSFANCTKLTSITIPSSVKFIGERVFVGCNALAEIVVDKANDYFVSDGSILYNIDKTRLYKCTPVNAKANLELPETIEIIDYLAFENVKSLLSISIPEATRRLGELKGSTADNPHKVFVGCTALANITVDSENTVYRSHSGVLYQQRPDGKTYILVYAPEGINALTEMPAYATVIGDNAFTDCAKITTIQISASITRLYGWSFKGLKGLAAFYIDAANPNYTSIDGIIYNKDATELIRVPEGKGGVVTVPQGVTKIVSYSFYKCEKVVLVDLHDEIAEIQAAAFLGCKSLWHITIPAKVQVIDERAFFDCSSLESVTFRTSSRLTAIRQEAFRGCIKLNSLTLTNADQVAQLGSATLYGVEKKIKIFVPLNLLEQYKVASGWNTFADSFSAIET